MMKFKNFSIALVALIAGASSFGAERPVKCLVESEGTPSFQGRCLFQAEKGGSFSLRSMKDGKDLVEDISSVSVYIVSKGKAEVSGLTSFGVNSRWGEAVRSDRDKACWVGSGFRVCAW